MKNPFQINKRKPVKLFKTYREEINERLRWVHLESSFTIEELKALNKVLNSQKV